MTAASSRATSPTPSSSSSARRLSLSQRIATLGVKLVRTASTETGTTVAEKERSQSRGREAFSTGRGGLGNLRQSSASASRTRPDEVGNLRQPSRARPDTLADSRGREAVLSSARNYSTGRGGAGNIRSPSRDTSKPMPEIIIAPGTEPLSSGRGGIGNIASRSRSRGPVVIVPSPTRRVPQMGTDVLDETDEANIGSCPSRQNKLYNDASQ